MRDNIKIFISFHPRTYCDYLCCCGKCQEYSYIDVKINNRTINTYPDEQSTRNALWEMEKTLGINPDDPNLFWTEYDITREGKCVAL